MSGGRASAERVAECASAGMLPVVCTVGYPSGAVPTMAKVVEACWALGAGAGEIDMVMALGPAKAGDWEAVRRDIAAVRAETEGAVLKVIVEAGALSRPELVQACIFAAAAGAEFVKTSTASRPYGGATVEAVQLMVATVGPHVQVKASGGIATRQAALAMLSAGATRLGTSSTSAVLAEQDQPADGPALSAR